MQILDGEETPSRIWNLIRVRNLRGSHSKTTLGK
jgi:hypothetical protein